MYAQFNQNQCFVGNIWRVLLLHLRFLLPRKLCDANISQPVDWRYINAHRLPSMTISWFQFDIVLIAIFLATPNSENVMDFHRIFFIGLLLAAVLVADSAGCNATRTCIANYFKWLSDLFNNTSGFGSGSGSAGGQAQWKDRIKKSITWFTNYFWSFVDLQLEFSENKNFKTWEYRFISNNFLSSHCIILNENKMKQKTEKN